MKTSAFVSASRAGTGKTYVMGQVAIYDNNVLHFQVNAPDFNRPYGMAFNTTAPEIALIAIRTILEDGSTKDAGARALSLFGSDRQYAVVQLKAVPDLGILHVQIPMRRGNVNRSYGAAFDVTAPDDVLKWLAGIRRAA